MRLLTEKEQKVLGGLYKLGSSPISKIAKETLLNRTALYHTIELLIDKGLVTRIQKEHGQYIQPISIEEYKMWAQNQVEEMRQQTETLEKWIAQQTESQSLYSDIRYFEGKEGLKHLYADTWRDNKDKIIYAITDYENAYAVLNEFLEKEYFPDRIRFGVQVKNLLPSSAAGKRDLARAKKLLRDVRFLDIFKNLGIEINIYGNKVAIMAFDKKHPTGILIKNALIAQALKDIFDHLWNSSSPAPTKPRR